jgi:hypothetical protein
VSERTQIALQLVIVVAVLAAAVYGIVTSARAETPPVAAVSAGPDASLIAQTLRSPSPSPTALARPAATPTASPTPTATRRPMALTAYSCIDRPCTGVQLGAGWTVLAPFDGRVELHVYQLVDGQIREFTDVAGQPKYPYVEVVAVDGRRMRYRPGALETATLLVAKDEAPVRAGDDLFRVASEGPSSWREFYDSAVTYQIVVSLYSAAGADLDASSLIKVK